MSCVDLLGILPRFPFVISKISAAPEAQFNQLRFLFKEVSLGASTTKNFKAEK